MTELDFLYGNEENLPSPKTKWYQWPVKGLFIIGAFIVSRLFLNHLQKRKRLERKFRYFKPTIHEGGFWGKRISWEARDKPLTDGEMK